MLTLRVPSFSEVQLNFSIPLLYGGMMRRDCKPTELYSYYLIAMRQLKAIQAALNANIEFDNKKELTIIRNAITEKTIAENLEISALSAGENLIIIM